ETLIKTVKLIAEGKAPRTPQDNSRATKCSVIKKEMGDICWGKSAEDIRNLVRALNPVPGAYTSYCGERLKIWKVAVTDRERGCHAPGEIVEASARGGLFVCAGDKVLEITELQAVGGKRMSAKEYLRAHIFDTGQVFTQEAR
ncbi:MAG TPA: methionyl-tRNA formyltransferase, partial [Clostridia bacterium]|nr:methionyl-tRNA formyltransferase [Clostridia bacterium]